MINKFKSRNFSNQKNRGLMMVHLNSKKSLFCDDKHQSMNKHLTGVEPRSQIPGKSFLTNKLIFPAEKYTNIREFSFFIFILPYFLQNEEYVCAKIWTFQRWHEKTTCLLFIKYSQNLRSNLAQKSAEQKIWKSELTGKSVLLKSFPRVFFRFSKLFSAKSSR